MGLAIVCFFSCAKNDLKQVEELSKAKEIPVEVSTGIEVIYTDSARLKAKLKAPEMRRYLRESSRVLRPGGRLIATFFLLNEESTPRLPSLHVLYQFPVIDGPMRLADGANPAEAVAIDEQTLAAEIAAAGFRRHTVLRGQWWGRAEATTFQDLVVCEK